MGLLRGRDYLSLDLCSFAGDKMMRRGFYMSTLKNGVLLRNRKAESRPLMKVICSLLLLAPCLSALIISCCKYFLINVKLRVFVLIVTNLLLVQSKMNTIFLSTLCFPLAPLLSCVCTLSRPFLLIYAP